MDDPSLECEQKLADIRKLADGISTANGTENSSSAAPNEANNEPLQAVPPGGVEGSSGDFEKILDQIPGIAEKKLAQSLLEHIAQSPNISWARDTFELKLASGAGDQLQPIRYSNILYLIKKCVSGVYDNGLLQERMMICLS